MFQRIFFFLLVTVAFSLPAAAQEISTNRPDTFLYTAQAVLLILGMAFAGYWAYEAFDTPPIKLGDGPTLPHYMTQPNQYRLGVIAYVGVCLLVYVLIAYFHKELLPLVGAVAPDLDKTIEKSMNDGSLPYPLVVIFSAAIFVSLLKVEKDWNPLFVLRRVVHGWVSIPQLANAVMVMACDELLVPVDARCNVAQYCRLAACFLVFKNQTQKNALRDAKQFGVTITPDVQRANPLRYTAIFFVAIMIAIYLGVSLSAMTWDLLHGNLNAAFSQDPDLITWWIGYALAIYGMPILAVLLLRYLGWTIDPGQPNSYLISYATVFLVALCVSGVSLAIAIKLAGTTHAATMSLPDLVLTRLKWAISPAVVAIYIAYHVDRQIDPLLPD